MTSLSAHAWWTCAVVVFGAAARAEPTCPHDAKVIALAELEEVGRAIGAQPEVRRWIADASASCKVQLTPRLLRTLEGLSQRCASALVELELHASDCREINVRVGGAPTRAFAIVAADKRGRLRPVQTFLRADPPIATPPGVPELARVECGGSLLSGDAGLAEVRSSVGEAGLRFDGCALRGVPVETVRREVLACLDRAGASEVTVRFFTAASRPACVVTTRHLLEGGQRVVVIRSGGLVPMGAQVDNPPAFQSSAAYFTLAGARPEWLCADLGLEQPAPSCSPTAAPLEAREGCVPPRGKGPLLETVAQAACPWTQSVVERHDVLLGSPDAGAGRIRLDRLVLESGHAILSESALAERLGAAVGSLAACAASPKTYDGALGALVISGSGAVAATALTQKDGKPLDDDCTPTALLLPLRTFSAKRDQRAGVAVYRFRLVVGP